MTPRTKGSLRFDLLRFYEYNEEVRILIRVLGVISIYHEFFKIENDKLLKISVRNGLQSQNGRSIIAKHVAFDHMQLDLSVKIE